MGLATIDPHSQKEHTEIQNGFPCLVLIRLVLTEIQRFKNVKIIKEMYGIRTASGWPYISLSILTFSNGCILLTFGSIYTKLGDFVKLGLHFITLWFNSCQSHNLQYLVLHGLKTGNSLRSSLDAISICKFLSALSSY